MHNQNRTGGRLLRTGTLSGYVHLVWKNSWIIRLLPREVELDFPLSQFLRDTKRGGDELVPLPECGQESSHWISYIYHAPAALGAFERTDSILHLFVPCHGR